jgi:SAM-dependent methyltransferase
MNSNFSQVTEAAPRILSPSTERARMLIRVPAVRALSLAARVGRALAGTVLSPVYWALAYRDNVPGLQFRKESASAALRMLFAGKGPLSYSDLYRLVFWPIDSVRYFEFSFMSDALAGLSIGRYLDVSSPRLFPLMFVSKHRAIQADLINPDRADLAVSGNFAAGFGVQNRCRLHNCLIGEASFEPDSFDLVTCMSVIEHIPEDKDAVQKMWDFVKPGGRLLLTVPCAAESRDEYIDRNEYGLLQPDEDNFFFYQRFYDSQLLSDNIFSITGKPRRTVVYGEKKRGSYVRNQAAKLSDPHYPTWREPYMMGQEWAYFDSVESLPGVAVIGMEFVKS